MLISKGSVAEPDTAYPDVAKMEKFGKCIVPKLPPPPTRRGTPSDASPPRALYVSIVAVIFPLDNACGPPESRVENITIHI